MPRQKTKNIEWFSAIHRIQAVEASLNTTSTIFNLAALLGICFLFFRYVDQGWIQWEDFSVTLFIGVTALLGINCVQYCALLFLRARRESLEEELLQNGYKPVHRPESFREVLRQEIKRAGRYHFPMTLCYLELDQEQLGRKNRSKEEPEKISERFQELSASIIRTSDYFCRLDHDQFCILLSHTDLHHAEFFIYRLLLQSQERLDLSFSSGLTSYRIGETPQQFVDRSQQALGRAKYQGVRKTHCAIGKDGEQVIKNF